MKFFRRFELAIFWACSGLINRCHYISDFKLVASFLSAPVTRVCCQAPLFKKVTVFFITLNMKIWTNEHVFNYSWETVANSQWRKYPNPHNTAVLGTDVLDRFVSSDGKLISKRIITSDWGLAPWVQTLIGANRYLSNF